MKQKERTDKIIIHCNTKLDDDHPKLMFFAVILSCRYHRLCKEVLSAVGLGNMLIFMRLHFYSRLQLSFFIIIIILIEVWEFLNPDQSYSKCF